MGLVWILTSFFGERHLIKRDEKTNLLGENKKGEIVAQALDGQRYPLPLCEFMWV